MSTIDRIDPISPFDDIEFATSRYATSSAMQPTLDDAIKALAHPLRREILCWLREPERYFPEQQYPLDLGVCAGQIDKRAGLSQSTVSAHLATLQRAGLVSSRKLGQWHLFRRNDAAIERFLTQLRQSL